MTFGKGVSGGYAALTGIAAGQRVIDAIAEGSGSFVHAQTFSHHPVACAAGVATMRYLKKHKLVERSAQMGRVLHEKLAAIAKLPHVGEVRGRGLLAGIEFVEDKGTRVPFPRSKKFAERVADAAIEAGVTVWSNVGHADGTNGDAALIAPMLLAQLLVLQPSGLTVLDSITHVPHPGTSRSRLFLIRLSRPFRNPLAIGSLIGLALALTGTTLPVAINAPLTLVGGMAVPSMLLAYGISLRLGGRPGGAEPPPQVGLLVVLKLVLQPIVAYLIGAYLVGLSGHDLLAVTVIAALPTAQNVFTFAMRYQRGVLLARDVIFVATILSVPAILLITWLLS